MTTDKWLLRYDQVMAIAREGKSLPVRHLVSDPLDVILANWITTQRVTYSQGKLSEERRELLENIPGWFWSGNDAIWNKWYQRLLEIIPEHGIPNSSTHSSANKKIGSWVERQRGLYRKGMLKDDKAKLLEKIDGWKWEEDWNKRRVEFIIFRRAHGRSPSTYSQKESEISIAHWMYRQRALKKAGKLPEDRIRALDETSGWQWGQSLSDEWQARFDELMGHVLKFGSIPSCDIPIGRWCCAQRKRRKDGLLEKDRENLLASVPGWFWDYKEWLWMRSYNSLEKYDRLPEKAQRAVSKWARGQMTLLRKRRLEKGRVELLKAHKIVRNVVKNAAGHPTRKG
jgi:hypothetical protein